jgi:hypothetical protein
MAKREQIDILFRMHADLQQMKQLQQQTARNKKQLGDLGKLLKSGLGMTVGIASFGALTLAMKRNTLAAIENGAAIHDNAKLYGVSAEFLQTWRYAAEQNGIQIQQSDVALQRFTRRLGEAAQGKGELLPIIKQYGIELKDAAGNTRSNVDVLGDFSELLKNTRDPAERLRIAFKLFDSEGAKLASVLADGKDGLAAFNEEMRDTNMLVSDQNVAALKRASDAMTSWGTKAKSVFSNVVGDAWRTVEAITMMAEIMRSTREEEKELREAALENLTGMSMEDIAALGPQGQRRLANLPNLSEERIQAEMTKLRVQKVREIVEVQKEELAELQKQRKEAEEIEKSETRRLELAAQEKELKESIAVFEDKLRYERLSIEEQLAEMLTKRAELEKTISETVLDQEEENKLLSEYRDVLKEIMAIELKLDTQREKASASVTGPEGKTASGADPLQNFADRMADVQNPQLIILNSMEAMYESINAQVQDLIAGTITWEQALRNVGGAVLSAVISTFAQMAAAAIASYVATQIGIKGMQSAAVSATMAQGSMAAAAWIPAAIAASIATLGTAAGVGAASFALAMLSGAASATLAAGLAGVGMAAMGAGPGYAEGGLVRGPGSGTSDSIPARLSDGEFVMRRAAVDAYGLDQMEQINAMRAPRTPPVKLDRANVSRASLPASREKRETTVLNIDGPNALADAIERQRGDLIQIKRRLGMA